MKESSKVSRSRSRKSVNPFRFLWKKFRLLFAPKWVRTYEKFKDK
jgi:hypothetical protein